MSWVLLSILAALLWAFTNIIDKYVLEKWVRKPIVPVIILGIFGLISSIIIYLFHGFSYLSYMNIGLALVSGILYILAVLLYFKAVKIEEISKIIPLYYSSPFFILILATLFLGEIFTPIMYLGIFLLVAGAILILLKRPIKIGFGKAFWFILTSSFLFAINGVITKYLLNSADYWTIFSYTRIGTVFVLIPILSLYFKDLKSTVKKHGKKVVYMMSLSEILNLVALLLITIATSISYVSLVNALSSVQPFFVLLFVVILSIFYPKILKEEIGKSTILLKLFAIVLMFIGAIIII